MTPRDHHLFAPGPKRILSIDGGGVRGVVALAYLERLEALLESQAGQPVRLCDAFDLIGGTSTGAIIATALALGHSAAEIRDFYLRMGPRVFRKHWARLPGLRAKFDAEALRRELVAIVGDRTLDSDDLQTGLAVMLKRIDKGGAWVLTNNPRAKYWETAPDRSYIGNRHYKLASVVRASTAAPHYFNPQKIDIVEGEKPALFVDGGLTPHNDPALALFLVAALPGHRLQWPLGADRLSIVSLGTGSYRPAFDGDALRSANSTAVALTSLMQQISEAQALILTLMSWLGLGGAPWPINSEIGDLTAHEPPFGALFRFSRYDIRLEAEWLRDTLGVAVSARELAALRRFDNPDALRPLYELAQKAAERQMRECPIPLLALDSPGRASEPD
jgi:hypothetical protein